MRVEIIEKMPERSGEMGLGALSTTQGNLPLTAISIGASISGFLSRATLTQTFYNAHKEALEATYLFPIPPRAAVQQFVMRLPDREIRGVVKERETAQQEYQAAIERGHQAAIAEEERPGLFTLRVGNIPSGTTVEVELIIVGPLQLNDDEASFVFPLVVAPRYIPGEPLDGASVGDGVALDTDAVPDASRISPPVLLPGFSSAVRLSIEVMIDPSGLTLTSLSTSLHQMKMTERDGCFVFTLQPGDKLDRDFILRFRFEASELQSHLLLSTSGSFFLTIVPPRAKTEPAPRDVVFLLDRSGSMEGWKFTAAKRALSRMLDTLREADRFSVCLFDTTVEAPSALVHATDQRRFQAIEELARAAVEGGTEMAPAFTYAANMLGDSARERYVVFVTDGQVGNEDQLLQLISSRLQGVRIFCLGIDQAVNEGFLRRVSSMANGLYEMVESEVRLDEVMSRLHRALMPPILTNILLQDDSLQIDPQSLRPSQMPDVFAGAPTQIFGRYTKPGALQIRGTLHNQETFSTTVEGLLLKEGESIDSLWARASLREMEEHFITGRGDRADLEKKMLDISTRFGVVCRFTALIAVDYDRVANHSGAQQKILQPVEAPAGWVDAGQITAGDRLSKMYLSQPIGANRPASSPTPVNGRVWLPPQPHLTRDESRTMTRSGMILGTPKYMSPEQAQAIKVDERSHVYSLGCLLYEVLCGETPNHADSYLQMLLNIIQQPSRKISEIDPSLKPFDELLARCLEKRPEDRYQTIKELAAELEALQKKIKLGGSIAGWMARFSKEKQKQEATLTSFTAKRSFGPYLIGEEHSSMIRGSLFFAAKRGADGASQVVLLEELNNYGDSNEQNKFMNEIRFVHPNSVEVIEAIQIADQALFLAFAYDPGLSLEDLLDGGVTAPPEIALAIFIQATRTLTEALSQGVTMQSLTSESIFITFDGKVKVQRWGAALAAKWLAPRVKYDDITDITNPTPQTLSAPLPTVIPEKTHHIATPERKQWWKFWK